MVNYLNASDGETITFGTPKAGIQNYPSNYKEQWFLIVPEGQQVQIDFDMFDLEDSKDCRNDYVEFREASISAGNPSVIFWLLWTNSDQSPVWKYKTEFDTESREHGLGSVQKQCKLYHSV